MDVQSLQRGEPDRSDGTRPVGYRSACGNMRDRRRETVISLKLPIKISGENPCGKFEIIIDEIIFRTMLYNT